MDSSALKICCFGIFAPFSCQKSQGHKIVIAYHDFPVWWCPFAEYKVEQRAVPRKIIFPTCLPPIMCGFVLNCSRGLWKENLNRHHGVWRFVFELCVPSEQFSERWKRVLKCPMMRAGWILTHHCSFGGLSSDITKRKQNFTSCFNNFNQLLIVFIRQDW